MFLSTTFSTGLHLCFFFFFFMLFFVFFFFFQAEDGIRDHCVTGVQTCALPISKGSVVTSDMLARDISLVPAGAAPAYLPLAKGYVAITIPTAEQQGVAGHISVGDYITVISSANLTRSEERRVGKEWRSGVAQYQ